MTNTFIMTSLQRQYETSGCRLTQNLVLPSDSGSKPPFPHQCQIVSIKHTEVQKRFSN